MLSLEYQDFLKNKLQRHIPSGFDLHPAQLNPQLFDYQRDVVSWMLRLGRAAAFEGTGLGKTIQQIEWCHQVWMYENRPGLILAPLAVAQQTVREAEKFGIRINLCESDSDVINGINIANYEKLHKLESQSFSAIALDESSILKSHDGHYRQFLTDFSVSIPYRSCWTATPAPNDHMELGTHAEFLGIMKRTEMLGTFFTHDGGETSKWRLKGHAEEEFWKWLCSWAVTLRSPADLGYDASAFQLPPLEFHSHVVDGKLAPENGELFIHEAQSLLDRRKARRASLDDRCQIAADIVNASDRPFIVWCDLNDEGNLLESLIPDAVQVQGSDKEDHKTNSFLDFADGAIRVIISKPSIAGFGMNWQHCADMAFVGLSDSWEQFYQAIRRCYRFGQQNPVNVHVIYSSQEGAVLRNLQRKENQALEMQAQMIRHMNLYTDIKHYQKPVFEYNPRESMVLPSWLFN